MNQVILVLFGLLFLVLLYTLSDSRKNQVQMQKYTQPEKVESGPDNTDVESEVVYTQDYYPWWRSSRSWAYDGWLYQKPYYNYWRRP